MRWKITGQILGLLLVVLPVIYISLLVFGALLFGRWRDLSGPNGLYAQASEITLAFEPHLRWENGQFQVDPARFEELRSRGAWLQVLDETGQEVYQQDKPASAPTHYTPAELILDYRYSGVIEDDERGYTLFVGMANRGERKFSYIVGFPDTEIIRSVLVANPRTIYLDVLQMLGGTLVLVTLVTLALAYLYGSRMAAGLAEIIDGILNLARGDYLKPYAEVGLYASVNHSLNQLSETLQANEAGRRKLEAAREEWIANISHDIKTPLSSLAGYAELLADPEYHFEEAEVRRYARTMQDKAAYIESLIEDLRLTYQLKNAALPVQRQPHNLVTLLRETVIDLLNTPIYSEAPLQFEPAQEEIIFSCDRRLLQRAINNLILNALVHNPPGTPITVGIRPVRGSIHPAGDICITICDQGQGIPPAEVERLFERYYRGTHTGQAHAGSGLGMAIAHQIVQAHGGAIQVHSQRGEGTCIEIWIDHHMHPSDPHP